jgi:hypothetical protein
VKLGQFTASDLRNFHELSEDDRQLAASVYGLPPNYMGYSSDNPPSAESILYSLERLIRGPRSGSCSWVADGSEPSGWCGPILGE